MEVTIQRLAMAYQGNLVEVRGRTGQVFRGIADGVNQRRGMFLRTSPFSRVFIPFFLITSIFLLSRRRRSFF
ncbi:hypothetical protein CR205_12910 [Alteribacter lacisalsi]|uniref:Uncharacterized protein n=1 Tax=Alteribacter lacisalsi TaxID=2045244 RepID=A0A2W0H440_9BACI|nr:hypothetical protein CR205_12910 [Alteribacter lacisalsi]